MRAASVRVSFSSRVEAKEEKNTIPNIMMKPQWNAVGCCLIMALYAASYQVALGHIAFLMIETYVAAFFAWIPNVKAVPLDTKRKTVSLLLWLRLEVIRVMKRYP